MKLIFTLYIFLFITSYTFSQDYTIRGFLYEKETGEVVLFEKVQLLSTDSVNIAGSTTDVNGFFNIPRVEKGTYILKVDNGNYTPFFQNIKIETNSGLVFHL